MNKGKRIGRIMLCLVVSLMMVMTMIPSLPTGMAFAAAGDTPDAEKTIIDNGDGTYTLSLDIVGESEVDTENTKANIVVVLDRSGSMRYYVESDTGRYGSNNDNPPSQNNVYGNNRVTLYLANGTEVTNETTPDPVYTRAWQGGRWVYTEYTGKRYADELRMAVAKEAVNDLVTEMQQYNAQVPNTVQMALVSFSDTASTNVQMTGTLSNITNAVNATTGQNAINPNGGTNWEQALQTARSIANNADDDPTYVIFVTDGNPTRYGTGQGTGQETTDNINTSYNRARDDAQGIVNDGFTLYNLGVFGSVDRMESLTDYANEATSADKGSATYYSVANKAELQEAFAEIISQISENIGITEVDIVDGTTQTVTTTAGVTHHLLEVVPNSFKYYRSGGGYGDMKEWTSSDDPAPPPANFNDETGQVEWDLSPIGVLENNVKYTVTFDVYPSQETYDLIAQLKNGDIQYSDIDPAVSQYIDESTYALRTNTTASYSWTDTREENPEEHSEEYTNPDPVATSSDSLPIKKEWEGGTPEASSVDITVLADEGTENEEAFHTATLTADNGWETSTFISVGIIKNGEPLPGAMGHDFSFAELDGSQYHWEIDAPVVRPMLIDGGGADHTPTMLIKVDEKHKAPSGATTYTIDGNTYYVDSSAVGLTATNHRRSNLNLTKVVTGEDAPEDAKFPFQLTVNNSLKPESEPSAQDDPEHESDWWVWLSVRDENGQGVTGLNMGSGVVEDSGGYYYAPSGTTWSLEIGAGWSLRFLNLPSGTKYTFVEGELADGFVFTSSELTQGEDSTFEGDQTTTGTIENTKTSYYVTYTNDYALTDLEITKVWDDGDDQDGLRLTPDELKAKLTLSPSVEGKEAKVVDNGDGTYTITYTGLPRYNNGQEVTYTVAESAIDGYTTDGSPAEDHGTITNSHTPEVTTVTVVKEWNDSDDIGGIRPTSIQAQLKADGTASGDPVTLNAGNQWTYTWENLPKYKNGGTEIVYTADETAVPAGYEKAVEKTTADDGTITFTVTNTYDPTPVSVDPPVQKVIENNSDLYNGGDFTFTIEATSPSDAPMPENTEITNSAAYELADREGFYEFGVITFTKPGTYTYTVKESGTVDGVENDPQGAAGKTLTFTVEDDGTGNLTVDPPTGQAQWTFTNTYDAEGEASITVTKALVGAAWPAGKTLTFTLTGTGDAPMPETTTETLTSAESVTFGPIKYELSDAGKTYTYTVSEGDGFGGAWTGSGDVTATVEVTDEGDGTLSTEVTYSPEDATITNTYEAEGETEITVTKELVGAAWPAGKTLTFTLTGTGEAPMPETTTATLTAAGDVTFGPIALDEGDAGKTYTYTVSEGTGFGGAWTGSGDVTATVEVTDNGDGTLATTVTYSPEDATITNTYEAEGETEITVTKALAGAAWPAGKSLTFTLTGSDGAPMPETTTATVTAAGDVTFGPIALDEGDAGQTYTYTVSEGTGFGGAWTGSGDVTATVEVTDNGDGTLATTVTYSPEDATITNTYEAEGETEITVTKALAGAAWPAGKSLTFTLTGSDGAPMPETTTATVTAAGDVTFGPIALDEGDAGQTYTYTVSEGTGFGTGWTGSGDITATVVVTDDGEGTVTAQVTYSPEDATITNTYEATGSATLKAKKLLTGREWMDGESFTFTLKDPNGTVLEEKTVTADGEVEFAAISYDESDAGKSYTYTIEETGNTSANVTPSGPVEATVAITDNGDGTLATAVAYSPEDATIINTYVPDPVNAQINVNKTIDGFLEGQPDKTFEFTLYEEDGETQVGESIEITTEGGTGSGSFAAIQYTAVGEYNYIVKETVEVVPGYTYSTIEYPVVVTVTDDPENGKLVAEVSYGEYTITSEDETLLDVINEFKMEDVDVTLTLTKIIEDQSNSAKDGTFNFTLYKDSVSEENLVEETSITTEGLTGSVDFKPLNFTASGEYTYVVVEEEGDVNGMTYDTTVHTYKIVIDDNFDAAVLEVDNENSTLAAEITNVYKATATSTVLKVKKEIEDTSGSAYETEFTFTLTGAEGSPMPEEEGGDTVTVRGAEEGEFGEIAYDKAGTFEYTIQEVAGDDAGYVYDSTEYKVTVTVEDQDGQLVATAAYMDKEGKSQTNLTITNTYDPKDAEIVITANKRVEDKTGGAAGNPKTFTFELLDADGNVIETVTRQGGGTVTFSKLTYSHVGEYNYIIREVPGSDSGYTYDSNEYGVIVEVTDPDKDGILKAAITAGDSVEFVNPYEAKPCGTEIELTKKLTGRDLEDGEFNFTLVDITGGGSEEIETVSNNEKGNITFSYIEYKMPGTYVYEVYEAVPEEANGVEYDNSIEVVTVKVTDDGNGELSASVSYGGDKTFENTYNAEGSFTPEVTKRLEGKDLKDGQFTFTMVGPDGQTYTAKNDAEGKVVFEALNFDLNDVGQTYEYTITEVNDGQANIKYDDHKVTLTITIADNGDGTLQISDDYSGKTDFNNKYEEPPAPPTGDTTVVVPYIVIGISALILLLMLLFRTRKNRA